MAHGCTNFCILVPKNLTRIKSFNVCKLNTLNLREHSGGTKTGLIPQVRDPAFVGQWKFDLCR